MNVPGRKGPVDREGWRKKRDRHDDEEGERPDDAP
jgi:hypothetical protein